MAFKTPKNSRTSNDPKITKKPPKSPTIKRGATKLTSNIIDMAKDEGLLPHEILLKASRGEVFKVKTRQLVKYSKGPKKGEIKEVRWFEEEYYPDFTEQVECAKAAAPFYAPRLTSQTIKTDERTSAALTGVMQNLAEKLPV